MPITTEHGETPWTARQIAAACRIAPSRATTKMATFEGQIVAIFQGIHATRPTMNPANAAKMLAAAVETAARLAAADPPGLRRRLRALAFRAAS